MPDYSLGKIYMVYPKVEDPDEGDVYYGSTTETLSRRMSKHRAQSCCKILFDKYGVENCFIELVEEYPCETREQLHKKEGEYIRNHKCINKRIAGRTHKQYYTENKDKIVEYHKEYYTENKDKIKESHKQYRTDNPDKIKEYKKQYRTENKDKILEGKKQYRTDNPDKIKEYQKQYYIENIDKIKELNKQKSNCPICNKEITKINMARHIKSGYCRSLRQSVRITDPESN